MALHISSWNWRSDMSEVARDLLWVCRQSGGKRQKRIGRIGKAERMMKRERGSRWECMCLCEAESGSENGEGG